MVQITLSTADIAQTLHPVFDEQIINYGAYNLVFASGTAVYRNPDIAQHQDADQQYFLIGYKDQPSEIVLAPLHLPSVTAAGTPTAIDNTNAIRAYTVSEDTFGLESTNGSSFILTLPALMQITTYQGSGLLDQSRDIEDFQQFLLSSWLEGSDIGQ
ncbi:MAG: hypothetical protein Q4C74_04915 [Rothia sp. (in: high G+C Gram-positive bacteria)]|nr:hypothetical protein [Rothia sp. (in: high G+C Gram-positive bacteria)]